MIIAWIIGVFCFAVFGALIITTIIVVGWIVWNIIALGLFAFSNGKIQVFRSFPDPKARERKLLSVEIARAYRVAQPMTINNSPAPDAAATMAAWKEEWKARERGIMGTYKS